jgi:hypothetical protein
MRKGRRAFALISAVGIATFGVVPGLFEKGASAARKKPKTTTTTLTTVACLLTAGFSGCGTTDGGSTTTTTTIPTCVGVQVTGDWQSAVNANPEGTTFCVSGDTPGVVTPKNGQKFIGPAILRGAIVKGGTDVSLKDIGIDGTGQPFGVRTGDRWILENVGVSFANIGIEVNDGVQILGGKVTDNKQYGFVGGPLVSLTVDGLECARNNTDHLPFGNAACMKVHGWNAGQQGSTDLHFVRMNVHDNWGHGIWCDWSCKDVEYRDNFVVGNEGIGIFHEVSFAAIMTGNTVSGNCLSHTQPSVWNCAEVMIANSRDVTVSNNAVTGWNGIIGKDPLRDDLGTPYGTATLCEVALSNNNISASGATSGWVSGRPSECTGTVWTEDGVSKPRLAT